MPFVTAGDPGPRFHPRSLPVVAEAGADLFEVGFPFSDPIADGPVIQASYTRALDKHLKLADRVRDAQGGDFAAGLEDAARGDGVVLADVQARDRPRSSTPRRPRGSAARSCPICPSKKRTTYRSSRPIAISSSILLVTPTTSPERAEKVVKACGGFVYVVSVVGITGARDRLPVGLRELLARLRTMTDLPLCVGFGVSKPEHVRELKEIADGVIVGSALVKQLEAAGKDRAAAMAGARQLVKELRSALATVPIR